MRTPTQPVSDAILAHTVDAALQLAGDGEQSVVLVADNVHVTQFSHAFLAVDARFAALNTGAPAIERQEVVAAFHRHELDVLVVVNHPANGFIKGSGSEITVLVPAPMGVNDDQLRSRMTRDPR